MNYLTNYNNYEYINFIILCLYVRTNIINIIIIENYCD